MLIGEIQKNVMERIRVTLSEYKGFEFIDIRVHYEDGTGEWKPTRKGVTVSPDKVLARQTAYMMNLYLKEKAKKEEDETNEIVQ